MSDIYVDLAVDPLGNRLAVDPSGDALLAYIELLTSQPVIFRQYQDSPVILNLIAYLAAYFDQSVNVSALVADVLNISTAIGAGMDVIGRRIGITRIINVPPYGPQPLGDDAFRTLLYAQCLANIWNGSIGGLNNILLVLFPGTNAYVSFPAKMAMNVNLGFTPTPAQLAILQEVFPVPVGLGINWGSASGGALTAIIPFNPPPVTATDVYGAHTFGPFVCNASLGSGSYSYAWSVTGASGTGTWSIASPNAKSTTLSISGVAQGTTATCTLQCIVTDTITGNGFTTSAGQFSFTNNANPGSLRAAIQPGQPAMSLASQTLTNAVSVSGGVAPFTYSWSLTNIMVPDNGGTVTASLNAANLATVAMTINIPATAVDVDGTISLVCTVTDSTGATAASQTAVYAFAG